MDTARAATMEMTVVKMMKTVTLEMMTQRSEVSVEVQAEADDRQLNRLEHCLRTLERRLGPCPCGYGRKHRLLRRYRPNHRRTRSCMYPSDGRKGQSSLDCSKIDNAVEMAAIVNRESRTDAKLYHVVANKLVGPAALWFVNLSASTTPEKKTYAYLRRLLRVEYGETLEPDQVISKLNERAMKNTETLNEYAAALRAIGQGCRGLEERWYVNAFKRGLPTYVRGLVLAAAPRTLDEAK